MLCSAKIGVSLRYSTGDIRSIIVWDFLTVWTNKVCSTVVVVFSSWILPTTCISVSWSWNCFTCLSQIDVFWGIFIPCPPRLSFRFSKLFFFLMPRDTALGTCWCLKTCCLAKFNTQINNFYISCIGAFRAQLNF